MKTKIGLFFCGIIGFLFVNYGKASTNYTSAFLSDSIEFVVACQNIDQQEMEIVKLTLNTDSRLKCLLYCNNHNVFLIRTNLTEYELSGVLQAINKQIGKDIISIKQKGFGDIINFCETDEGARRRTMRKPH